jgi:hypothetical protein
VAALEGYLGYSMPDDLLSGTGVRIAVALWGAFKAFFVLLLIGFITGGFGRSVFDLEASASMAGLIFAFAATVWLGRRRQPRARAWRQAAGAGSIPLFALTALMVWLGLGYGIWIAIIAAFPFLWALILEYTIHQRLRR